MTAPSPPLIAIEGITKKFGGVCALSDVHLKIMPGEFHAIVGENGAGKSTLMKILSGVLTEYDGRLLIDGEQRKFSGTADAEAAGISIIHQELNLVEELSAAANIFLGRELRTAWGLLDDRGMERQAGELFTRLQCEIRPAARVGSLRIGDQQLVEIAKALSLKSRILIMDEPTSALTESEVGRLFGVIERLRGDGVTILYISHKMEEVFRLSDRITVLRDGQHVRTLDRSDTSPREIAHLMVGREIETAGLSEDRSHGEELLEVTDLSLPWPGHAQAWRLRDISFRLHRGEVLGIAGLMGAGRTELLECLFGSASAPPAGCIRLEGREVAFTHPAEAMNAGVAFVSEDRKRLGLFDHFSVADNINLCTLGEAGRFGVLSAGRERELAGQSIEQLNVKTAGPRAPVTSLSGGNQQKCIIARWLRTRPKVLLLDDPTRGVDVGAKAEIYRVIDELRRDGLGILVTSSELPELLTLCDRILVLCEGRQTGEFVRGSFTEQAIMEAATKTAAAV